MPEISIISDQTSLVALAAELHACSAIAVDLEADSLHNYQEKVCLLQFSTPDRTVLVDPLALADLEALKPVMADAAVRKIFHAADYDIRCLYRDYQIEVRGLFDTMVSCQFLGEEKFGLADVLAKYFQLRLDKKLQKADWSVRPLSPEMVRYAAEDTLHLHRLAEILEKRLIEKGRLEWVAEECALLEQVRHTVNSGPLYLRFKGAWSLTPRQLAVLENLLTWRDREAQRRNCPPFRIIDNQALLAMAREMPRTVEEMKKPREVPSRLADRYGSPMLRAVEAAMSLPPEALPVYPRPERPVVDPQVEARLKRLKEWRAKKAAELGMEPGIVINNHLLEILALNPPAGIEDRKEVTAMKDWQRRELGPGLLKTLQ